MQEHTLSPTQATELGQSSSGHDPIRTILRSMILKGVESRVKQLFKQAVKLTSLSLLLMLMPVMYLLVSLIPRPVLVSGLAQYQEMVQSSDAGSSDPVDFDMCRAAYHFVVRTIQRPVQLWQRLERLTYRLEEQVNHLSAGILQSQPPSFTQPDSDSRTTISSQNPRTPVRSPATTSQVYHAALANNGTFDNLLASFDREKSMQARRGSLQNQEQSSPRRITRYWQRDTSASSVEHPEPARPYVSQVIESSPPLPSVEDGIRVPESSPEDVVSSGFMHSTSMRTSSTVSAAPSEQANPTKTESAVGPRCAACDRQACDDSETCSAKQKDPKPPFSTSMEAYKTVPQIKKKSSLPRRLPIRASIARPPKYSLTQDWNGA